MVTLVPDLKASVRFPWVTGELPYIQLAAADTILGLLQLLPPRRRHTSQQTTEVKAGCNGMCLRQSHRSSEGPHT